MSRTHKDPELSRDSSQMLASMQNQQDEMLLDDTNPNKRAKVSSYNAQTNQNVLPLNVPKSILKMVKEKAILHAKLTKKREHLVTQLQTLQLHLNDGTFPNKLEIKSSIIKELDPEAILSIHKTILTKHIAKTEELINEKTNQLSENTKKTQDTLDIFQDRIKFDMNQFDPNTLFYDTFDEYYVQYHLKEIKDHETKIKKKTKFEEMKIASQEEYTITKGEINKFQKTISNLTKKMNTLNLKVTGNRGRKNSIPKTKMKENQAKPKKSTTTPKRNQDPRKGPKKTPKKKPKRTKFKD